MGSGGRNESNSHPLARIDVKKIFVNWTYIMSTKKESNVFGLRRQK